MTSETLVRRRALPVVIMAVVSVVAALVVSLSSGPLAGATSTAAVHPSVAPAHHHRTGELALHDGMRLLWEQHVEWTRMAIVEFADGSAGFDTTAARLLQNQVDIGNAIKPYYGKAAGNKLTKLLKAHINIAVAVLKDAKSGDSAAFNQDKAKWYRNANQIADFLAASNPKAWHRSAMRHMMKVHLNQTLDEASDELGRDYSASVAEYEKVERHMLQMADMLSSGIVQAFPKRFR